MGLATFQLKRRHYVFWADDFNDDFVRGIMSTMHFEPLEGLNDIPSYLTARDLKRSLFLGLFRCASDYRALPPSLLFAPGSLAARPAGPSPPNTEVSPPGTVPYRIAREHATKESAACSL
jgi:hypothetical protein